MFAGLDVRMRNNGPVIWLAIRWRFVNKVNAVGVIAALLLARTSITICCSSSRATMASGSHFAGGDDNIMTDKILATNDTSMEKLHCHHKVGYAIDAFQSISNMGHCFDYLDIDVYNAFSLFRKHATQFERLMTEEDDSDAGEEQDDTYGSTRDEGASFLLDVVVYDLRDLLASLGRSTKHAEGMENAVLAVERALNYIGKNF